jgi:uncharacterized membrane protein
MKKSDVLSLLQKWLGEGSISNEQAAYMQAEIEQFTANRSSTQFIASIMYVGAAALALGVLMFIASNWEVLPKIFKLACALLLPVIPLLFAYYKLILKNTSMVLARAANVLGVAMIGGSMSIIGQVYNLEPDYTLFFWMWAVLSVPFLLLFRKVENTFSFAVLLAASVGASLLDLVESYRIESSGAILLFTYSALFYCAAMYFIGSLFRRVQAWEESTRLLRIGAGSISITILFVTTFDWYAQLLTNDWGLFRSGDDGSWIPYAILFNIVFIIYLVFVMHRAIRFEEYEFAFTVVRMFMLYLIVKYFTLFYDMFQTGILMIGGGILFITAGWLLERYRKDIIEYFKQMAPKNNAPSHPLI